MEKILMGIPVAYAFFTLLAYLLIIFNVPILIIPIALFMVILFRKYFYGEIKNIKIKFNKQTLIVLLVFIVGIAGQMAIISPSGRIINGDLVFWSAHGHDAPWHIALMDEINRGGQFQNPIFAGEKLVNYHFFSDILPAVVSKYLPVSKLDLYFRIFPFLYSLLLGASAYFLTKKITKNFSSSIWAVAFTYFAGSFGFVVTYLSNKTIGGESLFWASQIQSSSGNPPQIISNFLVLTLLYFIFIYIQKKRIKHLLISILILGTLAEFKVYGALVLLVATLLSGLWQIAIPAGILSAVLYLPNSSGSTSFLIFQPWWYIRTMIVEPSRLNWLDLEHRRQTYLVEHNWKRVIFLETVGFLIFFFGNLGVRFAGLWDFIKITRNALRDRFNLVFILTILISLILPLLFLQKGVAGNSIQFLQYFLLLFGILGGISVSRFINLLKKPLYQVPISLLIIGLMIPTQAGLLYAFYSRPPFAKITSGELAALKYIYIYSDKNSVIISPEANPKIKENTTVPNIWAWTDTAYVAAFSGRREYFSDKEQVDIMGYYYTDRENVRKTIFESNDPNLVKKAIAKSNANLIYFPEGQAPEVNLTTIGLTRFYSNSDVEVWKAN